MRRSRAALWPTLLLIAAPAAAQTPGIAVEPRVELLAILFKLAGNPEYNQNRLEPYQAAIERHFAPHREHEAVALARELRTRHGLGFSRVMSLAVRLTEPPELRPRVAFDSAAGWPLPPEEAEAFVGAVRRFARDSRATDFFEAQRPLYDSAGARLRRAVEREDLGWFARFFGTAPEEDFFVVPLLANSGTNFGPSVRRPGTRQEVYAILGHERHDAAGFPVYDDEVVATLVHEFNHSWANALAYAHGEEFERSAPRVHAQVADAMRAQGYSSWPSMVNESLVDAAVARYYATHKTPAALEEYLAEQRARSWLWLEELSDLFAEYEASRDAYPTLASFMPRVVAWFDSLPDRVPEMIRRYDALRPRIVSISVANGVVVDAALDEIEVRFDRPVRDDGWSVRPVLPDGRERFPQVTTRTLAADGLTFRVGLELEPGREYELQLNSAHGHGFRSVEDNVPLAPHRIWFRTRGARGGAGAGTETETWLRRRRRYRWARQPASRASSTGRTAASSPRRATRRKA